MRILFVCTGNTCRSPMAEALFNREMARRFPETQVTADSAGLAAFAGMPASGGAQTAMADAGLSLSAHRARPIDRAMVEAADLILTMTAAHADRLRLLFPDAAGKCFAYADYLNRAGGSAGRKPFADVSDPFGGDGGVYRACAEQLRGMTRALADALAEIAGSGIGSDAGSGAGAAVGSDAGSAAGSGTGATGSDVGSDAGSGGAPIPSI